MTRPHPDPVRAVRRQLCREHTALIQGIEACADLVVEEWTDDRTATRQSQAVVDPLERALESSGILEQLAVVLADAVDAAGCTLSAPPVPAPPYVVVTSRGPILRATIGPGRLVIRFETFEVVRDEFDRPVYQRLEEGVCLTVCLK